MNDRDRSLLKRAARDMILDTLVDQGKPLDSVPDAKLAQVFDEVMAYRPPMEKKAEAAPLTEEQLLMQKAAELSYLGRVAARIFVQKKTEGIQKLALNLETLRTKIRGITPEQQMKREQARREMEMKLVPLETEARRRSQEVAALGQQLKDLERVRAIQIKNLPEQSRREMEMKLVPLETEARRRSQEVAASGQQLKDLEQMRAIQLKDLSEQQNLAKSLRQLQLGDQFARRQREAQLYRELYGQEPYGKIKSLIGGGLLGFAGRRALMAAAAAGMPTAMRLAPLAGKMTGIGAALGLGAHLLGRDRPSRSLIRLERERYVPGSLSSDVAT